MAPLCSLVITNHNYAAYLPAAIESALAQTHADVEVIVVDDGSTDGSVEVARAFGDAIRLLRKANGGQASAMNAGFAASAGEIVLFLDSDDQLLPDIMARVVAAWGERTAKAQFRLQRVDADGVPLDGALLPPYPLPTARDQSGLVRRFGFYPSPPCSGNAFSRSYLARVMPLPEELYRNAADMLVIGPAPLHGEIVAIDGIGGLYRCHGGNASVIPADRLRLRIRQNLGLGAFMAERGSLARLGAAPPSARWPQHLKERLLFAKFVAASDDPLRGRLAAIALDYMRSVALWPEYRLPRRALLLAWALAMMLLPRALLATLPGVGGAGFTAAAFRPDT